MFQHYPKKLVATGTANCILTKSAALCSQISYIERYVGLVIQLDSDLLRLGVGPIIEQLMLPELLESSTKSTAGLQLSIVTDNDDLLLAMLNASQLDVVVEPFQANAHLSEKMMAIPMIEDTIIAIVRQGHPVVQSNARKEANILAYDRIPPKSQGKTRRDSEHPILQK